MTSKELKEVQKSLLVINETIAEYAAETGDFEITDIYLAINKAAKMINTKLKKES